MQVLDVSSRERKGDIGMQDLSLLFLYDDVSLIPRPTPPPTESMRSALCALVLDSELEFACRGS